MCTPFALLFVGVTIDIFADMFPTNLRGARIVSAVWHPINILMVYRRSGIDNYPVTAKDGIIRICRSLARGIRILRCKIVLSVIEFSVMLTPPIFEEGIENNRIKINVMIGRSVTPTVTVFLYFCSIYPRFNPHTWAHHNETNANRGKKSCIFDKTSDTGPGM